MCRREEERWFVIAVRYKSAYYGCTKKDSQATNRTHGLGHSLGAFYFWRFENGKT